MGMFSPGWVFRWRRIWKVSPPLWAMGFANLNPWFLGGEGGKMDFREERGNEKMGLGL